MACQTAFPRRLSTKPFSSYSRTHSANDDSEKLCASPAVLSLLTVLSRLTLPHNCTTGSLGVEACRAMKTIPVPRAEDSHASTAVQRKVMNREFMIVRFNFRVDPQSASAVVQKKHRMVGKLLVIWQRSTFNLPWNCSRWIHELSRQGIQETATRVISNS